MTRQSLGSVRQRLDSLWNGYRSHWRRLLSGRMIKELVLRASFDPKTISSSRIKKQVPPNQLPDCASCTNICCIGLENIVTLRLVDIAMLIDIGRTDLMAKKKPNFPAHMLRERPHLSELVGSELFRTLPVLKQQGPERACAALTQDNRCSLYPNWPLSCSRFPYSFVAAKKSVVWGTRCQSTIAKPDFAPRTEEMFEEAVGAYNERVRDAVLLAHARPDLESMGVGDWLTAPDEDPFEPRRPGALPVVR